MSDWIERDGHKYIGVEYLVLANATADRYGQRMISALATLRRIPHPFCPDADHKPLRSPVCRNCQIDARIEEAISQLTGSQE